MDRKPVELVRVPREEQYFDREEVLGRDAASVFPTEARKAAAAEGQALAEALGGGGKRFISETELEEIKTQRGLAVEDGTIAPEKPLAQILKEAKDAKEAAFQEQWKTMKQGKNRPLDEDEYLFLDTVAQRERDALLAAAREEEEALAAFHAAQQQQQPPAGEPAAAAAGGAEQQQPEAGQAADSAAAARLERPKKAAVVRPVVRAVVRVKGKDESEAAGGGGGAPQSKRQRTEHQGSGAESEEGPGLAGLLGGYGSDDSA